MKSSIWAELNISLPILGQNIFSKIEENLHWEISLPDSQTEWENKVWVKKRKKTTYVLNVGHLYTVIVDVTTGMCFPETSNEIETVTLSSPVNKTKWMFQAEDILVLTQKLRSKKYFYNFFFNLYSHIYSHILSLL